MEKKTVTFYILLQEKMISGSKVPISNKKALNTPLKSEPSKFE